MRLNLSVGGSLLRDNCRTDIDGRWLIRKVILTRTARQNYNIACWAYSYVCHLGFWRSQNGLSSWYNKPKEPAKKANFTFSKILISADQAFSKFRQHLM